MTKVAQDDRQTHGDAWYTAEELRRVAEAVNREAYPPAGRTGVGTVLRKQEAA